MSAATGAPVSVGVVREFTPGERRVALDPDAVTRLTRSGSAVWVEPGAGVLASFLDAAYRRAGATLAPLDEVVARCDVLAVVRPPSDDLATRLRPGQVVIGLVDPWGSGPLMARLAAAGVTVVAFELLPRTLSRAQSMDAVSSQANAAGYRAGVLAAATFDRYLPMMTTAAGTARPASVMVIGAGVAGLQAMGTVKRLGAVVTGYDVRPSSRGEVESVGATFLTSSVAEGAGAGGYARAMSAAEAVQQQDELSGHLVAQDVIITTAKVPGHTPPLLVTAATLAALRAGSVCIDMASGPVRGNVAGSVEGERTVSAGGVIVIGAGNLASDLAGSSSSMYARNVVALLSSLTRDGLIAIDPDDEVHRAVVVCHGGVLTASAPPSRRSVVQTAVRTGASTT